MKRPECKLLKASFAIIHANYCANNKAQQQGPKHPIFYTKDFAHLLPMKKIGHFKELTQRRKGTQMLKSFMTFAKKVESNRAQKIIGIIIMA